MNWQTKILAYALSAALVFALVQGGSWAVGGAASGDAAAAQKTSAGRRARAKSKASRKASSNRNAREAVYTVPANVKVNINANFGVNVNAGANVNEDANACGEKEGGSAVKKDERPGVGVERGGWGGRGVELNVEADGASVEFDCAHGRVERLTLDAAGNFEARGHIVYERGGPVHVDEKEQQRPARYAGKVAGETMTLTVTPEGDEQAALTYTLTRGRGARLMKCR